MDNGCFKENSENQVRVPLVRQKGSCKEPSVTDGQNLERHSNREEPINLKTTCMSLNKYVNEQVHRGTVGKGTERLIGF